MLKLLRGVENTLSLKVAIAELQMAPVLMPLAPFLRNFDREKFASSMNGPCSVLSGADHR
jgi:hypothetical protein